MADSTIANLTDGTTADATDRIPVERSPFGAGTNRYVTPNYIAKYILGGSYSANLTYTETSGPLLKVGTTAGNSGWVIGYAGFGSTAGMWHSSLGTSPAGSYAFRNDGTNSNLNAGSGGSISFSRNGTTIASFSGTTGAGLTISASAIGAATTGVQALSATQTWSNASQLFKAFTLTITDTNSAAGSLAMQILGGASGTTNWFKVAKNGAYLWTQAPYAVAESVVDALGFGAVTDPQNFPNMAGTYGAVLSAGDSNPFGGVKMGLALASGGKVSWDSTTSAAAGSPDTAIGRFAANGVVFGTSVAAGGSVTSRAEINKAVTAFTDGVAKTVFTLTIPNAAHSASYLVRLTGSIGAGGAIGANEATATNCYVVSITRTAGVNAVAGISAAFGASTSAVAGATTVTCTGALAAVSGAVGATNTIDIQATITKGGGASDNHTCVATASLLNANATGITIA